MQARRRVGFTLMEVLVVISIIGMLTSLLLPAVQAARESGRRATCQNNLKQIGLAMLNHESAYARFPSGGWGFGWAGDPDRGTGIRQPGGWTFSLLPYLERRDLARYGASLPDTEKRDFLTKVVQIPIPLFYCPTRRGMELSQLDPFPPPINFNLVGEVAQTDYAVNAGDTGCKGGPGPPSLSAGDNQTYPWADSSKCTGIAYLRSEVKMAHIRDGASHTYMNGEKHTTWSGKDLGDDQSMYSGYDYDTFRWAKPNSPPIPDNNTSAPARFGSAHFNVCQFVFCDGSVRPISFSIDAEVHRRLANRQDQLPIDDGQF